MTKRNVIEMNLPKADDLFSTQEERDNEKREYVKAIPLEKISDFPDHPFKVRMDEKMMEMIESVREYGVLSPAVVRPKEDGTYEMIAGHRRKLASQMADRPDIPCIVRDLTDEEATIIMVYQKVRTCANHERTAIRHFALFSGMSSFELTACKI